jgi:hypothetical protein
MGYEEWLLFRLLGSRFKVERSTAGNPIETVGKVKENIFFG